MNIKPTLFDNIDPAREAEADARAEQDVREGRLISHDAVRRWLLSWVEGRPFSRPKVGDQLRKIVWTDDAVEHLEAIVTYVAVFDLAAASRLADKLVQVADRLAEFSDRGRDAGNGMREMTTVWPYILRYRVEKNSVLILRIRHGAQQEDVPD